MNGHAKSFDETKYMLFFDKKMMNCWKNIIKFGIKLVMGLKKDLTVSQCVMKNM